MSLSQKSFHLRKSSEPRIINSKVQFQQPTHTQTPPNTTLKYRYEQIQSARAHRYQQLPNQHSNLEPTKSLQYSKSKFSSRHKSIVSSRTTTNVFDLEVNTDHNQQRKENAQQGYFNRYDDNLAKKVCSLLAPNPLDKIQPKAKSSRRFYQNYHIASTTKTNKAQKDVQEIVLFKQNHLDQLISRKQSSSGKEKEFRRKVKGKGKGDGYKKDKHLATEMLKLSEAQLIFKNQRNGKDELQGEGSEGSEGREVSGYWKCRNKFVSLSVVQKNGRGYLVHDNILSIYAEITIKDIRYVVSDEYKGFSLKHLIDQFGPFQEHISQRYLQQIALGLQHMHTHHSPHNRLKTTNILYNIHGHIFINPITATPLIPSAKHLAAQKQLHYFAPECLLPRSFSSNSLKNDIWAFGCIALQMFHGNARNSKFHPYNFTTFKDENEQKMIDNVRQVYFVEEKEEKTSNAIQVVRLSKKMIGLLGKCLQIMPENRWTVDQLLGHQFFQIS